MPVLVGGAAAALYSNGAYMTGDLDFVGEVPGEVAKSLELAGFSKQGRHWVNEAHQIFFELPGSQLDPPEEATILRVAEWDVLVLRPEDALTDRLAAWQFWRSLVDGIAAFWIWRSSAPNLHPGRVEASAENKKVQRALEALRSFDRALEGRTPDPEELTSWARKAF